MTLKLAETHLGGRLRAYVVEDGTEQGELIEGRWKNQLAAVDIYTDSHCRAMLTYVALGRLTDSFLMTGQPAAEKSLDT